MTTDYLYSINPDVQRHGEMERLLDRLPLDFGHVGHTLYSGRNTLKLLWCDGRAVVVKQFGPRLPWQQVDHRLHGSKGQKAYSNALWLLQHDFRTPQPLAYAEERGPVAVGRSWYLYEYTGGLTLGNVLYHYPETASKMGHLVGRLHNAGVLYRDINTGNVICTPGFSLIDTNRMVHLPDGQLPSERQWTREVVTFPHLDMGLFEDYATAYLHERGLYSPGQVQRLVALRRRRTRRANRSLAKRVKRAL